MKKLLLAAMIGSALSASAVPTSFDFSYASEVYNFLGTQQIETYDVAIYLPGEKFAGCKIKGINGPLYASNGTTCYSNTSVWLSSDLKLEGGVNVPDIASYSAQISPADNGVAWVQATLTEDYTIPAEGVYVGYSFDVSILNASSQYPVGIGSETPPNSFFLHTSKALTNWYDMVAAQGCCSAINVVLEADLPEQSVSFGSGPEAIMLEPGKSQKGMFEFKSTSANPVESIEIEYACGGVSKTISYELPSPVSMGIDKSFYAFLDIEAPENVIGETEAVLNVVKVNGVLNEAADATGTTLVGVYDFAPTHIPLMEEFTSTKCGFCVRGYAALEYLKENYPDFICAAYHYYFNGNDPMAVTTSAPVSVSGYPYASINRSVNGDPYYMSDSFDLQLPVVGDLFSQAGKRTSWAIRVNHTWDDDTHLTANVEFKNIDGYQNKSYKVGYLLVSDSLKNTATSWRQSNYYSTDSPSDSYIPELNNFCKGGIYGKSQVSGLIFNDVVINVDAFKGVANSVPKSLEAQEIATHSYTFDISSIKSDLISDKKNLRIVAFILDSNGRVLNAAKHDLADSSDPGAVEGIDADNADAPVEYYNLNGIKVDNPQGGIFIRRQGSKTSKVLIK